jgi:hypothetical protein
MWSVDPTGPAMVLAEQPGTRAPAHLILIDRDLSGSVASPLRPDSFECSRRSNSSGFRCARVGSVWPLRSGSLGFRPLGSIQFSTRSGSLGSLHGARVHSGSGLAALPAVGDHARPGATNEFASGCAKRPSAAHETPSDPGEQVQQLTRSWEFLPDMPSLAVTAWAGTASTTSGQSLPTREGVGSAARPARTGHRNDDRFTIAGVVVGAGATARIALPADVAPLGNKGGEISLLDRQAARLHSVAYTSAEARREGWTLSF